MFLDTSSLNRKNVHFVARHNHVKCRLDFCHDNGIHLGIDDATRDNQLAKGIVGKRLTNRRPNGKSRTSAHLALVEALG